MSSWAIIADGSGGAVLGELSVPLSDLGLGDGGGGEALSGLGAAADDNKRDPHKSASGRKFDTMRERVEFEENTAEPDWRDPRPRFAAQIDPRRFNVVVSVITRQSFSGYDVHDFKVDAKAGTAEFTVAKDGKRVRDVAVIGRIARMVKDLTEGVQSVSIIPVIEVARPSSQKAAQQMALATDDGKKTINIVLTRSDAAKAGLTVDPAAALAAKKAADAAKKAADAAKKKDDGRFGVQHHDPKPGESGFVSPKPGFVSPKPPPASAPPTGSTTASYQPRAGAGSPVKAFVPEATGESEIKGSTRGAMATQGATQSGASDASGDASASDASGASGKTPDEPTIEQPILKVKDTGDRVVELQEMLAKLGYYKGQKIDGGYFTDTIEAVMAFQIAIRADHRDGLGVYKADWTELRKRSGASAGNPKNEPAASAAEDKSNVIPINRDDSGKGSSSGGGGGGSSGGGSSGGGSSGGGEETFESPHYGPETTSSGPQASTAEQPGATPAREESGFNWAAIALAAAGVWFLMNRRKQKKDGRALGDGPIVDVLEDDEPEERPRRRARKKKRAA